MDLNTLCETPPWDWPKDAGKTFGQLLENRDAKPADRLTAADLAGNITVLDDELAGVLMTVLRNNSEPAELRVRTSSQSA